MSGDSEDAFFNRYTDPFKQSPFIDSFNLEDSGLLISFRFGSRIYRKFITNRFGFNLDNCSFWGKIFNASHVIQNCDFLKLARQKLCIAEGLRSESDMCKLFEKRLPSRDLLYYSIKV